MSRLLLLSIPLALALAGCVSEDDPPAADPTGPTGGTPPTSPTAPTSPTSPTSGTPPTSPPNATDATAVAIRGFAFDPAEVRVALGATVRWENFDTAPHTATADDGTFDSGTLSQGGTFEFTFDEAGTFAYICKIHPSMQGTVIVA